LRKNDEIIGIDSNRFQYFDELQNQLSGKKNKNIVLTVKRNGQQVSFPAEVDSLGRLGFYPYGAGNDFEQMDSLGWVKLNTNKYGFFAAFPAGVRKAGEELSFYIDQFKKILNPRTVVTKDWVDLKPLAQSFPNMDGTGKHFGRSLLFFQLSWLL
jgi:regulator of sigma E protease